MSKAIVIGCKYCGDQESIMTCGEAKMAIKRGWRYDNNYYICPKCGESNTALAIIYGSFMEGNDATD